MKKFVLILISLVLIGCTPNEADFKSNVPVVTPIGSPIGSPMDPQLEINWNVPFFPQAPDADWSMPWQEACEEAASILAYYYASDKKLIKEQFKKDVKGLVEWQNKNFGDYKHTNIAQTSEMIKGYFGYSDFKIIDNPTVDQMKKYFSDGQIIIAPFAGRQLKNPFYSGRGPLYHMMVIKGYDEKNFITNDVGTKRGHNFIYPYQTIMSAMHEWDDEDINNGKKRIIVFNYSNFEPGAK